MFYKLTYLILIALYCAAALIFIMVISLDNYS